MMLDNFIVKVIVEIRDSKTLMSVHLSENEFTENQKHIIDTLLKIPEAQKTKL